MIMAFQCIIRFQVALGLGQGRLWLGEVGLRLVLGEVGQGLCQSIVWFGYSQVWLYYQYPNIQLHPQVILRIPLEYPYSFIRVLLGYVWYCCSRRLRLWNCYGTVMVLLGILVLYGVIRYCCMSMALLGYCQVLCGISVLFGNSHVIKHSYDIVRVPLGSVVILGFDCVFLGLHYVFDEGSPKQIVWLIWNVGIVCKLIVYSARHHVIFLHFVVFP